MPIGHDTYIHRRRLPHLERHSKSYFVTWVTHKRTILPTAARDIALECCVYEHLKTYWLESAVVMPDHLHIVVTPYDDQLLKTIMRRIKRVSAHMIARRLGTRGHVLQREYFDRILRSDEDRRRKGEYICQNPVRAGLVSSVDDYPWIWRSWIEGEKSAAGSAALHTAR